MPTVRVRFFASARLAAGRPWVDWPVPRAGIPTARLVAELGRNFPSLRRVLGSSRFLRNDRYVDDLHERIAPGDEFAVHPPYGGG